MNRQTCRSSLQVTLDDDFNVPDSKPDILRLLAKDGLLVSDNVLQEGDVCESRFAVTRRNRTIHSRMRDYLYEIKNNGVFETAVLNIGDGVALSVKK